MAAALPFISVFMTAVGAVQQFKSAREAKKAGERNAQMEREMADEEARRTEIEQMKTESAARARAAASGVTGEGSIKAFLEKMSEEHEDELAWIRKSGRMRSEIARQEGKAGYTSGMAGGFAGLGSAASQGYNWWGKK